MGLKDIITVNITRNTQAVARASFGFPCIVSEFLTSKTTVAFTRFRWYGELSEMIADGWTTSDPEYKKAQALVSQPLRVTKWGIGRKDAADADWATALSNIQLENDEWYGLIAIPDGTFATDVKAIAAWIETQKKVYAVQVTDAAVLTSGTTDLAYELKQLGYDRTFLIYHASANADEAADAAWLGEGLPYDPGTSTWAFKSLTGVTPDAFTTAQRAYALDKNCNIYLVEGAKTITEFGTACSGEYIDIIIGTDWVETRLMENCYAPLATQRKVAFDDGGITSMGGIVKATLQEAAGLGILQADSLSVTVPLYKNVPQADRATRKLPGVKFSGLYQGAIHRVEIQGTLGV